MNTQTLEHPAGIPVTGQNCRHCGHQLITHYYWDRQTPERRAELRQAGYRRQWRVDGCQYCLQRFERRAESAREASTATYRRDELLEEWLLLVDRGESLRDNCRRIAPRLGMKTRTLEQALYRAGVRAWVV